MAWMAQDRDEETNITIGLVDLITFATRSFKPTVQDIDFGTYASILNDNGMDSFTNQEKGRSTSILRLPGSPNLFRTNGQHVVFSASFLTHYTVWEIRIDTKTPIVGKSYSLDPDWNDFLCQIWTDSPDWNGHSSLSYYLSIDDRCDIYTTINGFLKEKGCFNYYDRFLSRYACRVDGMPYRMKSTAGIPPNRNAELSDSDPCFVAARLVSFPSGGQNLFSYSPADTKLEEEDSETPRYILFEGNCQRLPRIVVDRKQSRRDRDWERFYQSDFQPGSKFATDFEYNVQYLNFGAIYRFPASGMPAEKSSQTKVIPDLSPNGVAWQLRYNDEQISADEGEEDLVVRRVRIVGLKPTPLSKRSSVPKDYDNESLEVSDFGDGTQEDQRREEENREQENQEQENRAINVGDLGFGEEATSYFLRKENTPEPASICELVLDQNLNRNIRWEGDSQYIVLRHYTPVPVPSGEEPPVPSFTSTFTLFRYGNKVEAPISYSIRYCDDNS
ncbi:hypothetical protein TWF506_009248 [Arthrobotrys conoides]|uniref:Uncharacterized protein n=1 Tax=Arthrobotrys conoides TaxID=74498 RepID=A0AAN8PEG4_9PEZI